MHITVYSVDLQEMEELLSVPHDYEPCGDCGYDHSYEQQEAYNWHSQNEEEE